jgi:GMP synthase (glutamine-hydrolysing)
VRIGLLRCDEVGGDRLGRYGGYQQLFTELLNHGDTEVVVTDYDLVAGRFPGDPGEQDGWLVTGARAAAFDDDPWIAELLDLIRVLDAAQAPTVGVCFGHQAIALALGGTVRNTGSWGVGVRHAEMVDPSPASAPVDDGFRIAYSHRDQVVDLPATARLTSAAAHCPVASFAIGDHMIGIQGHPEFGTDFARDLYTGRFINIGEEAANDAMATLDDGTDRFAVADWMMRILVG